MKNQLFDSIKIIIMIICLFSIGIFMIVGLVKVTTYYNEEQSINNNKFIEIEHWYENDGYYYKLVYDKDTKVEYIIVSGARKYGICPYYNSDGQVAIYKEK